MEDLKKQLKSLGLSSTEASIYLAGVGNLPLGVAELNKVTNIKRPTIYHALYGLMEKGLVARSGTEARMKFNFAPPQQLEHVIYSQIQQLKKKTSLVQELIKNLQPPASEQTVVGHYEGIEGVKTVIDEALYCKSHQWDILAPVKNFFSEYDKQYAEYFMTTRQRHKITARSLWEAKIGSSELTAADIAARQPRYLPKVMHGKFDAVVILFDDKVAIISSLKELSAILITSQEIHKLFSAMFEGLWATSVPVKR
jgi:sugar-specific transcriptional regulator TrmB